SLFLLLRPCLVHVHASSPLLPCARPLSGCGAGRPDPPRRRGRRRTGQERDAPARSVLLTSCRRSDGADLLGLRPLVALADLELHALPLVEGAVAVHVDLAVVHEDVCAASVDLDESVALFGVEPLDRALCHTCHLLCRPSTIARRDRGAA